MRKLTTVLMAAIMVFTLAACGTPAETPETVAPAEETVTTVAATTTAPETTKAPETTAAPTTEAATTVAETEEVETETAPSEEAETEPWNYGERIEVSENGEILTVRLEANATTGYRWSHKIWDEGSLELLTDEYIERPHADGMVGVGGAWVGSFRLTSDRDGRNYINFYYSRGEMDVPAYVVDIFFKDGTLQVTGEHFNNLDLYEYEDGEFKDISLNFENMFEENELSFYATADVLSPMVFNDEEYNKITLGDRFTGKMYGTDVEIEIEMLEKIDDYSWRINPDSEVLCYNKRLNGWIIMGDDDDILYNIDKTISVHFTNETRINDQMEEILNTGNSGTIYDKLRDYNHVEASLTVKDGVATDITIFYHP